MVFSSIIFLFYFLPVFLLAYSIPDSQHRRNVVLVAFSLVFYAWGEPLYITLMLLSIGMNYWFGQRIGRAEEPSRRRWLCLAVTLDVCLLGAFKYTPFLVRNVSDLLGVHFPLQTSLLAIPLPLGISFYTFQAISYVVDVYRRRFAPEQSVLDLAAYVTMFPHLIAGPIVRYQEIRDELHTTQISDERLLQGAQIFVLGLSAKLLIANTFSQYADQVFGLEPALLTSALAWLGAVSYTFQIYFDFNGYSIMAIGLAMMLGFTFPRNFDRPYISTSITEFWRRWHISLSTWFRDYLYIPLGGNRAGPFKTYRNLLIVFVVCGVWHGAGWTFLLWGLLHGVFLVFERLVQPIGWRVPRIVLHVYAMLVVVCGWVLFRSPTLASAGAYFAAMLGRNVKPIYQPQEVWSPVWIALALVASVCAAVRLERNPREWPFPRIATQAGWATLSAACVWVLVCGTHNPFIYFRF